MKIIAFFALLSAALLSSGCSEEPVSRIAQGSVFMWPMHVLATKSGRGMFLNSYGADAAIHRPEQGDGFLIVNGVPVVTVVDTYFLTEFGSDASMAFFYRGFTNVYARELLVKLAKNAEIKERRGVLYSSVDGLLYVVRVTGFEFRCNLHPHIRDIYPSVCPMCELAMSPVVSPPSRP